MGFHIRGLSYFDENDMAWFYKQYYFRHWFLYPWYLGIFCLVIGLPFVLFAFGESIEAYTKIFRMWLFADFFTRLFDFNEGGGYDD